MIYYLITLYIITSLKVGIHDNRRLPTSPCLRPTRGTVASKIVRKSAFGIKIQNFWLDRFDIFFDVQCSVFSLQEAEFNWPCNGTIYSYHETNARFCLEIRTEKYPSFHLFPFHILIIHLKILRNSQIFSNTSLRQMTPRIRIYHRTSRIHIA